MKKKSNSNKGDTEMATELVTSGTEISLHEELRNQLMAETTEGLKQRLVSVLARSAEDLREMSMVVAELESRGEDLTDLRLGLVDHLRRIAAGQLLPEIVVRFSGFPQMLRIASHLPLADQGRLAAGEPVKLAVWREDRIDWREIDPLHLARHQVHQVFAADRIRNQAEQVALLEDQATRERSPRCRKPRGVVYMDRARGGIVVKRTFVAAADVVKALSELSGPEPEESRDMTLVVKLSNDEHAALKQAALDGAVSASDLARRALRAHGLL